MRGVKSILCFICLSGLVACANAETAGDGTLALSQNEVVSEAISENTLSENSASDNSVSDNSVSQDMLAEEPMETVSQDTLSENTAEVEAPHKIYLGKLGVMSNAYYVNLTGIDCRGLDVNAFLDSLTGVREVRMKDNHLTNEDYAALQDAHPDMRIVWDIKIKNWTIPTDTVAFSTMIGLQGNLRIDNEDAQYLRYCHDMVALDLGHNYIYDLSFLESMPELKIFIIVDNYPYQGCGYRLKDISPIRHCKKLRYLEIFANSVEDISALEDLKELEDLNVCYNPIKSADAIKNLPKLKRLWIYSTYIPREEIQELKELYPDTQIVTSGSGSVDQGWRSGERYTAMRDMVKNNVIDPLYEDSEEDSAADGE